MNGDWWREALSLDNGSQMLHLSVHLSGGAALATPHVADVTADTALDAVLGPQFGPHAGHEGTGCVGAMYPQPLGPAASAAAGATDVLAHLARHSSDEARIAEERATTTAEVLAASTQPCRPLTHARHLQTVE